MEEVTEGHDKAKQVLTTFADHLVTLAEALLEYETLTGDEINKLLETGEIDRDPSDPADDGGSRKVGAGRRSSVPTSRGSDTGPLPGTGPEPQPGT